MPQVEASAEEQVPPQPSAWPHWSPEQLGVQQDALPHLPQVPESALEQVPPQPSA